MSSPPSDLVSQLPEGQVVDRTWLLKKGFSRPRVDAFIRNGVLQAVARGAYRRPGPPLKWQHLLYSLRELGHDLHVGGLSALQQQGLSHYLALSDKNAIQLYGITALPSWLSKLEGDFAFTLHKQKLFEVLPESALLNQPFGHWDWPIPYAKPELALLELAAEVGNKADFSQLDKLFDSAVNLRPLLLQSLLSSCGQVKAKRLFLWFAQRHHHAWFNALNVDGVDLGSGKRMIVSGGVLDKHYQITVPKEMVKHDDEFF